MKRCILAAAVLAGGLTGLTGPVQAADDAQLRAAIAGSHRSAANAARDNWRHPYETLTFFGIKPDMTVVELSPGGGWYTEILAPYLRDNGKLIAAGAAFNPAKRSTVAFKQKLDANPAAFGKVVQGVFEPPSTYNFAAPGSADMVLTFRNLHNWIDAGGDEELKGVFKAAYTSLKRGGVLGIEEHRLPEAMPQDAKTSSGYVHESYVIKLAESAGFKLAAKSDINANPKDKADHKGGVWALPPTLANRDQDREKYQAIGESDRMTLRFVKP
ncbi:class I SAM-dependent methyltransferase [Massilia forsythiae]|uniref:Class I SAM-dependent methyltransferase n=1 Tax=Massilia forsythiae TaxID=2728020 RepID=A0A7Z2ZTM8_9BURK|nr:class I SAM-dependent methyltransferase [Massilia forsythiae]QJE01539.1 class I SAM-dependent methyltransferase [Massilia forsythiae]